MSFKRILCAVDFSPDSLEAFHVAVETGRLHSGSLHIFHVIEALPAVPPQVEIRIVEEANAAMEKLVASAGSKGTTSLEEIIIGGTAENVMKEAPCSVLVVRTDDKRKAD